MNAKPKPLNKHDLHIINQALALLEAHVDGDDYYAPRASGQVRRVRERVFAHIAARGGYDPDLGLSTDAGWLT